MSKEEPDSGKIPQQILNELNQLSGETLREVSKYTEELAESKSRRGTSSENPEAKSADSSAALNAETSSNITSEDQSSVQDRGDVPDGVPRKASVTTKEINGNRYHYWQWREGEKVKSKYKGPADSE